MAAPAIGLSSFAGYRLYLKNNPEKHLQEAVANDNKICKSSSSR